MEMQNNFVAFEYRNLLIEKNMESIFIDSFPCFGWKFESSKILFTNSNKVEMKFKRDRKIRNKAELTRLQRQFEASVEEIRVLEKSKTLKASICAFAIGVFGTICMAGATFSYLASTIWLMTVLAVFGFLGWIIPYFCYRKLLERKSKHVIPLIEMKYDEVYEICEKASRLLGVTTDLKSKNLE